MKLPLQIYLDSSDYSRAAAANPTAETQDVLRRLGAWRDGGQIQIRYTFSLVAENAPAAPAYLPSGIGRLSCIQELCGDCVLIAPSLVVALEQNALVAGLPHTASIARDDGNWTPLDPSEVTFPARESVLRQGLAGDKTIDRHMRRVIERRVFDRSGKFTAEGEAEFRKLAPAFVAEIERRFPLTPNVKTAIRSYVEGRLSGDDAWRTVMRSVQDLSVFSSWLTKDWAEVSKATLWIRQSGERMTQNWLDLADRVTVLVESQKGGNLTDEQIWAIGDKELTKIARRIVLGRARGSSQGADLSDNDLWTLAPSTMLVASMLVELIRATVLQSGSPRKPKASDAGDLLHAVYLPHVDLYRTDSFAADKLAHIAPQYAARIVRDFHELPVRIEALLR